MPDFLKLAQEAYEASTGFFESNYRADLDYSLRAFRNEHAAGSKYLSEEYKHRSRIFRPKTRSIIRKNESAAMHSMFLNREFINVEAMNPDDAQSVAASAALKAVMEYRMSRTIPTFEIYLGGVQDAQTTGVVCSYQFWNYEERNGQKYKDEPCIELRPIENIRLDAGASWTDPVESSPYFCDIIPMYVNDVKTMMAADDPKTGKPKWKKLPDSEIVKSRPDVIESMRVSRTGQNKQDPLADQPQLKEFETVWVLRWFIRDGGTDKHFYTMGTNALLTDPVDLEEAYFHNRRPYAIGYAILETHKAIKSGIPVLTRPLQQAANQLENSRFDNVQFVLNKRWFVARGRQVDVNSLVRNVPGGVTMLTDPKADVQESNWPDVTSSSYVEQDRLNSDFDDLAGNFSPSTKVANNAVNDTLGGSKMASQSAGMMTDYLLRTINATWWEKVIRQVCLLEQYYESDQMILAICANKAQLFPRFGISRITDMLLLNEVVVTVDASHGDPSQKLQKFMLATNAANQIVAQSPPGANVGEMVKEIYSTAGYRDGARFWNTQVDPRLQKAMQMVQQLQAQLQGKQAELQAQAAIQQAQIASNEKIKGVELQIDQMRIQGDLQIRASELEVEKQKLQIESAKVMIDAHAAQAQGDEAQVKIANMRAGLAQAEAKLQAEQVKLNAVATKAAAEIRKAELELLTAQDEHQNEAKIGQLSEGMSSHMQSTNAEIATIKSHIANVGGEVAKQMDSLRSGMAAMAGMMTMPKRKAVKFNLVKPDGKRTKGVKVEYDDGTTDDMAIQ